ncbi:MAG: type II toxin-antitoxin system RelE/ParE family toxin [Deltaproteobacteria bacterium]|nr:type II toxin-antitoxin system RelE/ParE family toxin [Deltaproteobacteria bacterium]
MSNYSRFYHDNFIRDLKRIKANPELRIRLEDKIEEIMESPNHYKTLRNVLKGRRRVHLGSFVLVFEVIEEANVVIFHKFRHHDEVYK